MSNFFYSFLILIISINLTLAIQCDCFCRDKPINKLYPKSCAECTIELCKKNNSKGYTGWCLFGKRAVHCSEYNDIPPIYVS